MHKSLELKPEHDISVGVARCRDGTVGLLKEYGEGLWDRFIWVKKDPVTNACTYGNKSYDPVKTG